MRIISSIFVLFLFSAMQLTAADKPKFGPDGLRTVQNWTNLPGPRPDGMQVVKSFSPADFSFVKRSLLNEPTYKSKNPRYTIFVLGEAESAVLTIVWDESQGTGTGHDLLYVDLNQNGDLGDDGAALKLPPLAGTGKDAFHRLKIPNIAERGGERHFDFSFELKEPLVFTFRSKVTVRIGETKLYTVGLVPGPTDLHHAGSLAEAPIYRIGGTAIPSFHERRKKERVNALPGQAVLPRAAGEGVKYVLSLAQYGDRPEANLRFKNAAFPGVDEGVRDVNIWGHAKQVKGAAYPLGIFQQLDEDGGVRRELSMQPGCSCGGGHNQQILIPANTPPGTHRLVIRIYGQALVGGLVEYHYPITVTAAKTAK